MGSEGTEEVTTIRRTTLRSFGVVVTSSEKDQATGNFASG